MKFLMFDFDGVIVSSFALAYETMQKIGTAPETEEQYRDYFNGNIYKTAGPKVGGGTQHITEPTPFFKLYGPALIQKQPVPGMIELLKELKTDGYRMVIISSTMDSILDDFLNVHGIRDCFDALYGATYHTDKAFKIERALEDTQTAPTGAFFITDTLGDLYDAKACHVPAVGVTWGYHARERLKQGSPITIVDTVEELRMAIKQ
jgi:phosphoglycolate phosphatase